MNGYGSKALDEIDVELKEAVCDALVNTIVGRVSGTDEPSRNRLWPIATALDRLGPSSSPL